ncbi:fumarylacetoacetase [Pseudomonas sp. NPDC087336]|uniref:fumarylacetoacetase n=1 Tax=Pseudomonas sp. NPDC087336 TaxID=3364436 RepID=UPI00382C9E36
MTQTSITRSWVASANGHADFPLQNLPLGVFSVKGAAPRSGVAIGDHIFDLEAALDAGLFDGAAKAAVEATCGGQLNAFFELGREARVALRERLIELLKDGSTLHGKIEAQGAKLLPLAADCQMHVPAKINDYTDFYVGIEHAQNVGKLFRPDNPLLPNYKYVPIGYHGRASTIRPSGTDVRRPKGQTLPAGQTEPTFGPCARLDYELELGIWIGQGNDMGDSIAIGDAADHIAGFCLLNDWSARDIQAWEYQPLGPFLSKSFITSISPWVVTAEALEPFRLAQPARPEGDPQPLPYLFDKRDQAAGAFNIELEVLLLTEAMREQNLPAHRLALSNSKHMYWTVAQLVAHHSVNGCQLQAGDLFGSGTLSGPQNDQLGSLLEITEGGKKPIELASGEVRKFLEDGDEIILRGRCSREGFASIGFGECRGKVLPAR